MKNILLTISFVFTTTTIAMELPREENPKTLARITTIKNPKYAQYLTNDRVIIADGHRWSIINPNTSKEIKKISDLEPHHLAIHPNRKKFALTHKNTVNVYDTENHIITWSKTIGNENNFITSATFSPHDATIFLVHHSYDGYHKIKKYNYEHDNIKNKSPNYTTLPFIAFNPIQKEMCVHHRVKGLISFYEPDIVISPDEKGTIDFYTCQQNCQYSPDGSYIVAKQGNYKIYIINLQGIIKPFKMYIEDDIEYTRDLHKDNVTCIKHFMFNSENIEAMLFHSNSVLATLVTEEIRKELNIFHRSILHYWDIQTQKLISSTLLANFELHPYDLSFSPDTTKVIVILGDACVILPVPFEVMYKNITKETFSYLLFLLKNYTASCEGIEMPQDINLLIAKILLETHKRQ